jgi:hypothetical protein
MSARVVFGALISTFAFFFASWYFKRRFEEMDLPEGTTRTVTVFAFALAVSYAAWAAVDWIAGKL